MKIVNAMGDACPLPVVKTKKAIRELKGGDIVETLVDNEIAVQNLTKMANKNHYGVRSEKIDEGQYRVIITVDQAPSEHQLDEDDEKVYTNEPGTAAEEEDETAAAPRRKKTIVAISSERIGTGDDELGSVLMKSFIFALSQQDILPDTILFYNGGAKLPCRNRDIIKDLREMQSRGVAVMTCGTCLNHYGITEELKVGTVTNMYDIAEAMMEADTVIRP